MRIRFSLWTLLLLIMLAALGLAWQRIRSQNVRLEVDIAAMRRIARELRVEDPTQIAIVARKPTMPGELIHDIYIPPTPSGHKIFVALEGILGHPPGTPSHPAPNATAELTPGKHAIDIQHNQSRDAEGVTENEIVILVDGAPVIEMHRPEDWVPSGGWSSMGSYNESKSFSPDEPLDIHRRRFHKPTSPNSSRSMPNSEPANGILVWIEPAST